VLQNIDWRADHATKQRLVRLRPLNIVSDWWSIARLVLYEGEFLQGWLYVKEVLRQHSC
jgi:hypothetical protein